MNMFLELDNKVRVVDLKRTRVSTPKDTSEKVPMILYSSNYPQPGTDLRCLGRVRFIHTTPYS